MKKNLLLITNNSYSEPILHSQLLNIYKLNLFNFENKYLFASKADNIEENNFIFLENFKEDFFLIRYFRFFFNIRRFLQENDENGFIIHIRGFVSGFLFNLVRYSLNKKFSYIYDPRGVFIEEFIERYPKFIFLKRVFYFFEKKLVRDAFLVIVTSFKFKDFYIHKHGNHKSIEVCYNCTSFKPVKFQNIRKQIGDRISICYIGAINFWHPLDEIVRVIRYLHNTFNKYNVEIFLYTAPSLKTKIIDKLTKEGLTNFTVGFLPYNKVEEALKNMDICLSIVKPTKSSALASVIKIADYLTLGKTVILNEGIGDFDDFFINKKSSLIYKFGEPITFTENDIFTLRGEHNNLIRDKFLIETNASIINNQILKYQENKFCN